MLGIRTLGRECLPSSKQSLTSITWTIALTWAPQSSRPRWRATTRTCGWWLRYFTCLYLSPIVTTCHHLSPHVSPCHELTVDHQDGRSIAVHRALLASSPLIALAEEACCCHLPRVSPAPGQETVGVAGGAGWGDLADRAGGGQPPVHRAV